MMNQTVKRLAKAVERWRVLDHDAKCERERVQEARLAILRPLFAVLDDLADVAVYAENARPAPLKELWQREKMAPLIRFPCSVYTGDESFLATVDDGLVRVTCSRLGKLDVAMTAEHAADKLIEFIATMDVEWKVTKKGSSG